MQSPNLIESARFALSPIEAKVLRAFVLESDAGFPVSDIFRGLDLDGQPQELLLTLSSLGLRTAWYGFPKNVIPRLKGIHKFLQTKTLIDIPWFSEKLSKLTSAGIDVMLLKGIAVQAHFAPKLVRNRMDLDVLVRESDYLKAQSVLESPETIIFSNYIHHAQVFSLNAKNRLEIHRWAFRAHNDNLFNVWPSARRINCFGSSAYVFDPYTMLVHLCDTKAYDIATASKTGRKLQPLIDIISIVQSMSNFNLSSLAWRAEELCATCPTKFIFMTLAEYLPELFNPLDVESVFSTDGHYNKWLKLLVTTNESISKYLSYGYKEGEKLTFSRDLRILKKDRAEYKYLDWVFRYSEPRLSFYKYLLASRGISSIKDYSDFREVKKRFAAFING